MKKISTSSYASKLTLLACALLVNFSMVQAQLITNSGFESWPPNCPLNQVPDSWTNYSTTAAAPDQAGACAGTVSSHSGGSHMNLGWINSGLEEGAVQTISGLTLGTVYRVSFWGINNQGLYATPGDVVLELHKNSNMVFSTGNLVSGGIWTEYTFEFTATAPSEAIGMRVKPGTAGTSGAAGVDDFTVTELVSVRDGMMHLPKAYFTRSDAQIHLEQGDYVQGNAQHIPLSISNMLGQTVLATDVNFVAGKASVDASGLQPGIYVISMTVGEHLVQQKFFVN